MIHTLWLLVESFKLCGTFGAGGWLGWFQWVGVGARQGGQLGSVGGGGGRGRVVGGWGQGGAASTCRNILTSI